MWAFERRWVESILGTFAPADSGELAPEPGAIDFLDTFEGMLARARLQVRIGLRLALWLAALSPLWALHRLRSFAALSLPERQSLLARLLEHRVYAVREAALLLKLVACLALFANDALRARSGYDDPAGELIPLSARRGPA